MQLSKTQTTELVIFSRAGAVNKPGVAPERSAARQSSSLIKITLQTDCVNYIPGSNEAVRGAGGGVGRPSTPPSSVNCLSASNQTPLRPQAAPLSPVHPPPLSEC